MNSKCCGYNDQSDFGDKLVSILDVGDRILMLVTKMAKTFTNIGHLSETHFVSNNRHKHRCNRYSGT